MALYQIQGWHMVQANEREVIVRPGWRVVLRRLPWAIIGVVAVVAMTQWERPRYVAPHTLVPSRPPAWERDGYSTDEGVLGAEAERDILRRVAEKQAERTRQRREAMNSIEQVWTVVWWTGWVVSVTFLCLSALALGSCAWTGLRIWRGMRGDVVVRWMGSLLPKTIHFRPDEYGQMNVAAQEVILHPRGAGEVHAGWRWTVRLAPRGECSGPELSFLVHQDNHTPSGMGTLPEPVSGFVIALSRVTGLTYGEPYIAHYGRTPHGRMGVGVPTGRTRSFDGDDRAHVSPDVMQQRITFNDADGREHVFASPDDMPPEIRQLYERARRQHGK